jgi:hypothetical protein
MAVQRAAATSWLLLCMLTCTGVVCRALVCQTVKDAEVGVAKPGTALVAPGCT